MPKVEGNVKSEFENQWGGELISTADLSQPQVTGDVAEWCTALWRLKGGFESEPSQGYSMIPSPKLSHNTSYSLG